MNRPFVTLKLATSLDGKIALANGQSEWITGGKSRAAGRRLRAKHDGIAVGANTAVMDNPQLTTRIEFERDPIRIVFDTNLRLSPGSNLALTASETPVWILCKSTEGRRAKILSSLGVKLLKVAEDDGLSVTDAMRVLHRRDISKLLVEGGGTLAASFIRHDLVDVIEWFRAPLILGGDGRNGIGDLGLEQLDLARRFNRVAINELGDDIHERYERAG